MNYGSYDSKNSSTGEFPSEFRCPENHDSVSVKTEKNDLDEDLCLEFCVEEKPTKECLSEFTTEGENTVTNARVTNSSQSKSGPEKERLNVLFETIKAEPEIVSPEKNSTLDIHDSVDDLNECILPNEIDLNSGTTLKNLVVSTKETEMKEKFPMVKIHLMDLECESGQPEKISFKNKCNICNRNFSTMQLLNDHHQAAHAKILFKYECFFCPEKFSLEWFLKNHLETIHSGIVVRFTCSLCKKTFYSKCTLEDHKRKDHNIRDHPLNCNHCEESFGVIGQLRKHLIQFHVGTIEAANADSNIKLKETIIAEKKQSFLECKACKKVFPTVMCKKNHIDLEHDGKYVCPCGKSFTSTLRLVQHEWTHQKKTKMFKCEICANTFSFSKCLDLHYKIHSHFKEVKHVCSKCRKVFVDESSLKHHIRQVHSNSTKTTKPKIHTCTDCGWTYKNVWLLRAHERKQHPKDQGRYFSCQQCQKTFSRLKSFTLHKRVHKTPAASKPRPINASFETVEDDPVYKDIDIMACFSQKSSTFSCPKCTYSTERKYHFRRHLGNHSKYEHKNSSFEAVEEDLDYIEIDVMACFSQKSSKFSCPVCNYSTERKYHFRRHLGNHSKLNKPKNSSFETDQDPDYKEIDVMTCFSQKSSKFSCPVCVYSTERKNHFRRHLKGIHSIISSQRQENLSNLQMKPMHKCTKCDKMFSRKDLLYTHDRLRHVQVAQQSKPNPSRPLMIECALCKKNIPTGQLILHINRHKYSVCHSVSSKSQKIDMNDLYCEDTKMFKCCFCNEKTPVAPKVFSKHLQVAHKCKIIYDRHKNVREGFPFQCSKCDMRLASKFHWREHELRHGKVRKSRSKPKKMTE